METYGTGKMFIVAWYLITRGIRSVVFDYVEAHKFWNHKSIRLEVRFVKKVSLRHSVLRLGQGCKSGWNKVVDSVRLRKCLSQKYNPKTLAQDFQKDLDQDRIENIIFNKKIEFYRARKQEKFCCY